MTDIDDQPFSLRDGRRTMFRFDILPPNGDDLFKYRAVWQTTPGVYARLKPTVSNKLVALPGLTPYWEAAGIGTPWESYDFPGFTLTTKDGTQYRIDREDLEEHFVLTEEGESSFVRAYGEGTLTRISERRLEADNSYSTATVAYGYDNLRRLVSDSTSFSLFQGYARGVCPRNPMALNVTERCLMPAIDICGESGLNMTGFNGWPVCRQAGGIGPDFLNLTRERTTMKIEEKLKAKGLTLPEAKFGQGKIEPAVRTGNLIFTSGHVSNCKGKVGKDVTQQQAYDGARDAALGCLAAVRGLVGDLDKVVRVVKVLGMVNCAEGFYDTPAVIHGCTDLLNEVFGDKGRHARSAVGLYQLPANFSVEVELVVEVRD